MIVKAMPVLDSLHSRNYIRDEAFHLATEGVGAYEFTSEGNSVIQYTNATKMPTATHKPNQRSR